MSARSFCESVLLPLAVITAVVLLLGCEPSPSTPRGKAPKVAPVVTPVDVAPLPKEGHQCSRPQLIAYGAEWCVYCRAGEPKLADLERRGVEVIRVNIDEHPDWAAQNQVTSVPVYFVVRCGHPTVRTQSIDEAVRLMDEIFHR